MSNSQDGRREGAARRHDPAEKLQQLCDADARSVDPELQLVAGAVIAGQAMPDPYTEAQQLQSTVDSARGWLETKPSANSVRAAGIRLQRAMAGVVKDVAAEKGRAA